MTLKDFQRPSKTIKDSKTLKDSDRLFENLQNCDTTAKITNDSFYIIICECFIVSRSIFKCFMVQFGRVHLHALYNNHSQHCRTCLACQRLGMWNVDGDVNLLDRCARGERVYLLVPAPLLFSRQILMEC